MAANTDDTIIVGPSDRDWWTVEFDIIPPDPNKTGDTWTLKGTTINRCTGESYSAEEHPENYIDFYLECTPTNNKHTPWALAVGEATAELINKLTDHLDKLGMDNTYPDKPGKDS